MLENVIVVLVVVAAASVGIILACRNLTGRSRGCPRGQDVADCPAAGPCRTPAAPDKDHRPPADRPADADDQADRA